MLSHMEELLDAYADGDIADIQLWTLLLQVLGKSFEVDDGGMSTYFLLQPLTILTSHNISLLDRTAPSPSDSSSHLPNPSLPHRHPTTKDPDLISPINNFRTGFEVSQFVNLPDDAFRRSSNSYGGFEDPR